MEANVFQPLLASFQQDSIYNSYENHTCPTCGTSVQSTKQFGRIQSKHKQPNGRICPVTHWHMKADIWEHTHDPTGPDKWSLKTAKHTCCERALSEFKYGHILSPAANTAAPQKNQLPAGYPHTLAAGRKSQCPWRTTYAKTELKKPLACLLKF